MPKPTTSSHVCAPPATTSQAIPTPVDVNTCPAEPWLPWAPAEITVGNTSTAVSIPDPVSVMSLAAEFPTIKTDVKSWATPPPPTISLTLKVTVLLLSFTSVPINKSEPAGDTVG